MNDRFKLKCFNKLQNKMYEVRSISYYQGNIKRIEVDDNGKILIFDDYENNIDNCILIQSTGLKDKNGKLIYEGDIVKFRTTKNIWEKGKVVFASDCALFEVRYGDKNVYKWELMDKYTYEVIGNIYETPELLEVKE